jgi:hypothetical protein
MMGPAIGRGASAAPGQATRQQKDGGHLERHDFDRGLLATLTDAVFKHSHLFCISRDSVTNKVLCVD